MATAIRTMPEPTMEHGPATRHVTLSKRHEGQIVTPVVCAWYAGSVKGGGRRYVVLLSSYDASDRTYSEATEFAGDFWACTKWLESQGVHADIDAA